MREIPGGNSKGARNYEMLSECLKNRALDASLEEIAGSFTFKYLEKKCDEI